MDQGPPSTVVQVMIPLGGAFPAVTGFEVFEWDALGISQHPCVMSISSHFQRPSIPC